MIEFRCTTCQHKLGVPETHAGKKARCSKCQAIVTVPRQIMPSETGDDLMKAVLELASEERAAPTGLSSISPISPQSHHTVTLPSPKLINRIIGWSAETKIAVGGISLVAVMILFVVAYMTINSMIEGYRKSAALTQLSAEVKNAIRESDSADADFGFDRALARLETADQKVKSSDLPSERLDTMNEQLRAARSRVADSRADYKQKILAGYVAKNGRLVSPQEQLKAKEELAAEAKRQQEEQQTREAQKRAEEVSGGVVEVLSRISWSNFSNLNVKVDSSKVDGRSIVARGTVSYSFTSVKTKTNDEIAAEAYVENVHKYGRVPSSGSKREAFDRDLYADNEIKHRVMSEKGFERVPGGYRSSEAVYMQEQFEIAFDRESLAITNVVFPQDGRNKVEVPLAVRTRAAQVVDDVMTMMKVEELTPAAKLLTVSPVQSKYRIPAKLHPQRWDITSVICSPMKQDDVFVFVRLECLESASPCVLMMGFDDREHRMTLNDNAWWASTPKIEFVDLTREQILDAAAEQGDAKVQYNLGVCYENGTGVEQDWHKAVKWWRKAAEQDLANAQYNLGVCYENGTGVEQGWREAVKWYRKAAEQGFANAQSNLGVCYENGKGVEEDPVRAVKWYRMAAEQGFDAAQFNLGVCYLNGTGVRKDPVEAVKWFRKAAEQGFAPAKRALITIEQP